MWTDDIACSNEMKDSLADEKYIYGTEVELVEVGQRCETIIGWVLTSIELRRYDVSIHHWTVLRAGDSP